jgi:biotin transport system substrate-specific component
MELLSSNSISENSSKIALNGIKILAGSLFLGLASQVAFILPWTHVLVTFQTLAIFILGVTLGPKKAALSVLLYLVEGAAGLPVFPLAQSGIATLFGPKGGYYFAFIAAALISGTAKKEDSFIKLSLTFLAANASIYVMGLLWLSFFIEMPYVLAFGFYPFIIGDVLKILAATALTRGMHSIKG